ncbi:MAG: TIGR04283 family arsenosugar biosynthesis glycosyltransferase [Fimbriimonadaceae bacterium]|nr:TIGR04283 family arsenosugar biosynthesis glycosyltransferase [Alphaproteobacteria bacterium]
MLSIVIPTLDAERDLGRTLEALVPGAVAGIVTEVIVADGGSVDGTGMIADQAGCRIIKVKKGRGNQLAAGAKHARARWLLFLHGDTILDDDWIEDARDFIVEVEGNGKPKAAVFRFALASRRSSARLIEFGVGLRSKLFALPYGDQGLLISRDLYDEIGGYRDMAIMEDVEIVRRLGRRRIVCLSAKATTSAARYEQDGFLKRVLRNLSCLALYMLGVSPGKIQRRYG